MPVENSQKNGTSRSSYLDYLPSSFRDDEVIGQLLLIFESILKPVENSVDNLALYFDPTVTPESMLPWLACWVGLALDPIVPLGRRRELVRSAADLYRWRGTRRGLSEYLRICTGCVPEISEHIPGMRLDAETKLGINTRLGSSGTGFHFAVTLENSGGLTINMLRALIDSQKPAYAVYTLNITSAESVPVP